MQLTWQFFATLLTAAGVVPALTALVVKLNASATIKNLVSAALAAAAAVIAYLVDVPGVPDWTTAAILAASAWGLAGGFRKSTVVGSVEAAVANATGHAGIG